MADEGYLFEGWINPLAWLEVDEPWASARPVEVTLEHAVGFLCPPGTPDDVSSLVARYREISKEQPRLFLAPAEPEVLEKLIWPLRQAKASYVLGNYLSTIALCGMVAEMLAILRFDIGRMHLKGQPISEKNQERLFGDRFERLGQERRVKVLRALEFITEEEAEQFDQIREARRRYLHFFSQTHDRLAADAARLYQVAVALVVSVIGQDLQDGKIILRPDVLRYLLERGLARKRRGQPPGEQAP